MRTEQTCFTNQKEHECAVCLVYRLGYSLVHAPGFSLAEFSFLKLELSKKSFGFISKHLKEQGEENEHPSATASYA